ncbi:hypothetical protein DRO69_03245 [Candidatus Bathyarchaeota archaeon]|nr:MAG: hypothetical protein DRO69_03245 [Candidatus Bathyarchaeota archaeon]
MRHLKFHEVKDLVLMVDYKAEQILNYFDDGSRFNVKISYVHDKPELKGTAGSVLNAYKHGRLDVKDTLLVYYGDILTNINLKNLLQYHQAKRSSATVALASGFTVRVGLADMEEDGKLKGFAEKPKLEKPVSIGILALKGETILDMDKLKKERRGLDLMKHVIPHLVKIGKPVYGYLSDAFWYDVGSTEAYEKLSPKLVEETFSYLF